MVTQLDPLLVVYSSLIFGIFKAFQVRFWVEAPDQFSPPFGDVITTVLGRLLSEVYPSYGPPMYLPEAGCNCPEMVNTCADID
jgi:hypothetical protein